MNIFTVSNTKTLKSIEFGYLTAICHLAPSSLSGWNVCPNASEGCTEACLNTSGLGILESTQKARKARTMLYFTDREKFYTLADKNIKALVRKAERENLKLALRPNGTSDLPAFGIKIAETYSDIPVYDYTKIDKTFDRELPKNYYLTFSRSESNQEAVERMMDKGANVAMVFGDELPSEYKGFKVINGDEHDARFLDERGVIVGLSAKGQAKKDDSGFVIWDY